MNTTKIVLLKDTARGGEDRTKEFQMLFTTCLKDLGLAETVQVVRAAEMGVYGDGVCARVLPEDLLYTGVEADDVRAICETTVRDGKPCAERLSAKKSKQERVVLRNCGVIDPESIEDAVAHGGYEGLKRFLSSMKPEEALDELKAAGLRGRGGAGYPTWMKWKFARAAAGDRKYIICNADEGDPGAYMDRSTLEGDPHAVLEGMIIGGRTIGASEGFFYIRAEYPLAVERAKKAIEQAYAAGLLGKNILGSGFDFDVEIRLGAGAFVCGEETALIASIEGKRGTPRPRPPYPSVKGLWDKPTVINNVETLACVSYIFQKGSAPFAAIGAGDSRGTKVFALTGKVRNSGLIEVPMGISLREIVFDIGGGMFDERKKIKAVQTGGPSGGVIPESLLDTPVDYENLGKLGSIIGSGGMIVMDESDCMVDIARFYMQFCVDESCGKCAPCRGGTRHMLNLLTKIAEGKAVLADLEKLRRIARATQKASLCGLGQTAANPVLSTLRYFEDEYKQHIIQRKCRAGKCRALVTYWINQEKCKRCSVCFKNCPVQAISGDRERGFYIQLDKCTKCGTCFEVCKFGAIAKE